MLRKKVKIKFFHLNMKKLENSEAAFNFSMRVFK